MMFAWQQAELSLFFEALPRWEVVTFARAVTAAGATFHGNH